MNPKFYRTAQHTVSVGVSFARNAFDVTATWVTQLSWWKFLLFALLLIIAGSLVQGALFDDTIAHTEEVSKKGAGMHSKLVRSDKPHTIVTDDGAEIRIDDTGLHITKKATAKKAGGNPNDDRDVATSKEGAATAAAAGDGAAKTTGASSAPLIPDATHAAHQKALGELGLHLNLPPEIGRQVRTALEDAVDEKAQQKVLVAQKKSSEWFMNFILLLVVGLFGTKALMGGKKRAEAQAHAANAVAERATLQREIVEAKMQVMQAQVEPHFLFNTLASVEYLIETDPPRASAMQRSLIQYLRAVLPQMRETAAATNLGREADMVRAYLDLLKMRMEERLQVDFRIPAGLRSAAFPPMMLQSLVENAIKHGLECKEQGGTLQVIAEVVDNRLRVTVADDGLGFGAVPSNGTGLGLQSIRERLKLLFQDRGQLEITANQPSGVRAVVDVPYQLAGKL
ncbi:MAG: histidine kinase [Herminiimonas sp.]|nr:histidine kinase [Herminiimonas sp.]